MFTKTDLQEEIDRVKTCTFIDVLPWAYELRDNVAHGIIRDPERGFYFEYSTLRIPELRKQLYYHDGQFLRPLISFEDAIEHKRPLYDNKGSAVISIREAPTFYSRVSCLPVIPANECNVIISCIREYLCNTTESKILLNEFKLREFMSDGHGWLLDYKEMMPEGVLKQLEDFIAGDYYHIYSMRVSGTSVVVTKEIDRRIYEWYQDRMISSNDSE